MTPLECSDQRVVRGRVMRTDLERRLAGVNPQDEESLIAAFIAAFNTDPEWSVFRARSDAPEELDNAFALLPWLLPRRLKSKPTRHNTWPNGQTVLWFSAPNELCTCTPDACSFFPSAFLHDDLVNPPNRADILTIARAAASGQPHPFSAVRGSDQASIEDLVLAMCTYCDLTFVGWDDLANPCLKWKDSGGEPASTQRGRLITHRDL